MIRTTESVISLVFLSRVLCSWYKIFSNSDNPCFSILGSFATKHWKSKSWVVHRFRVYRNRPYRRRIETDFRWGAQRADNCLWSKLYVPLTPISPISKTQILLCIHKADIFPNHCTHLRSKRSSCMCPFFLISTVCGRGRRERESLRLTTWNRQVMPISRILWTMCREVLRDLSVPTFTS